MTNMTAAQYRASLKPKVKKRNPDPAPTTPPNLIKGFASDGLFEDDLLMCEIEIVPPSVNNYWLDSGKGRKRLSKRARHFTAVMARFIHPCRYDGKVSVNIEYAPPDAKTRDIDNIVKPIFDSLSKCGLILDDKQVDKLVVERLPVEKDGKLVIYVRKI